MHNASGWSAIAFLAACTIGIGLADEPTPEPKKENPFRAADPAPSALAKPAPIDATVAALVADLGSEDYQTRERAGKKLAAMGEKALPDLRRALDAAETPEVSRRLSVLVRKLDYDRLVNPKRVTLNVKDKPVKEILDEISKQTGYKIQFGGGREDQKFSFEFDNVAFWPAMDQVANAAGLSVNPGYDDDSIHLYQQNAVSPFVSYSGPFRLVASYISTSKNIQLSNLNPNGFGNRGQEYITMSFQIFSEPKNPILGVNPVELIVADDETGASLIPAKDPNNRSTSHYYNNGYRSHNASGNLNLVRGAKDASTIKQLKGRVGIVLLSGTVPEIVIPDPLSIKTKKFMGRSAALDIEAITENGQGTGQYTLAVTVSRVNSDPNHYDYSWANNAWQKMELIDEKGNKYRAQHYNHINSTPTSIQMTVPFGPDTRVPNPPKLGPPVKFVFNEWLSVTTEVTFEFKDVPLP